MPKTRPNKKPFPGDARHYALIVLAAMLVMGWQFVFPAVYQTSNDDAAIMFKYVPQFVESFRQGIILPRWMPDDFNGYGSPIFVFYSPLLYLLAALGNLAGLDIVSAKTILELLRLCTGGVFLYLLVKENHGTKAALAAALFYTLLPTRILDLYSVNSPAGRFAQAFMPMSLYFTRRYMAEPFGRLNLAAASFSYAALVLSHLATAYIFTPFLFAYGILGTGTRLNARTVTKAALVIAAGLLLSAFFFLPVIVEGGNIQLQFMKRFAYGDYFLFDFIIRPIPADKAKLSSLLTGTVAAEAVLLALLLRLGWRRASGMLNRETGFYLGAVLVCLFMMSSLSAFLWMAIPGLATVQFPSRFETVNILFVSALLGIAFSVFFGWQGRPRGLSAIVAVVFAVLIAYDAVIVARSYAFTSREAANVATNIYFPEYLPKAVFVGGLDGLKRDQSLLSSGNGFTSRIKKWDATERLFLAESPGGASLRVRTFWFPGWKAWVDGSETAVSPEDKSGAVVLNVPAGSHLVRLGFVDTPPRRWGKVISLLTLAALVFPYGAVRMRRTVKG